MACLFPLAPATAMECTAKIPAVSQSFWAILFSLYSRHRHRYNSTHSTSCAHYPMDWLPSLSVFVHYPPG